MKADLHCHTNYSFDSTNSVSAVLDAAKKAGIKVLAVTDHNQFQGSNEAVRCKDLHVISGIEIDCFLEDKIVHLLGYDLDLSLPAFVEIRDHYDAELKRIADERLKVIEARYNCKLDLKKIKSLSHFDGFSNVEIERVLLEDVKDPELTPYQTGDKKDNPLANYYWDHLSIGKWGYVAIDLPDYKDIINLVHEAGGACICAHPNINIEHDETYINKLIEAGIDGFEVWCSYHKMDDSKFYKDIVDKYNLIATAGSDYHGVTKPNIQIGQTNFNGDCTVMVEQLLSCAESYR